MGKKGKKPRVVWKNFWGVLVMAEEEAAAVTSVEEYAALQDDPQASKVAAGSSAPQEEAVTAGKPEEAPPQEASSMGSGKSEGYEPVPPLRLVCHLPNSNAAGHVVYFPIFEGNRPHFYDIDGFERKYCVGRIGGGGGGYHKIDVTDYISDLESWIECNEVWDEEVKKWNGSFTPSDNTKKIIRSMLHVVFNLHKGGHFHGAMHCLQNWVILPNYEVSLLYKNMEPQEGLDEPKDFDTGFSTDMMGIHAAIEQVLKVDDFENHREDIKTLISYLINPTTFDKVRYHLILKNPCLFGWKMRGIFVLNAMQSFKALSVAKQENFKSAIDREWTNWNTKIPANSPLKSVYLWDTSYQGSGFDLFRFHKNVLGHIHDRVQKIDPVTGQPEMTGRHIPLKTDPFWSMKFVESELSRIFPSFLSRLFFHIQNKPELISMLISL